jgi:hypothetical protein
MSLAVQQQVLWLQVPVDHSQRIMEVSEDENDLRGVKASGRSRKAMDTAEVGEEFASGGVFQL